jgi:hypothetical protein
MHVSTAIAYLRGKELKYRRLRGKGKKGGINADILLTSRLFKVDLLVKEGALRVMYALRPKEYSHV